MRAIWKNILLTVLCMAANCSDKGRLIQAEAIVHDIYTLDHFIELVEKIERDPTTSSSLDNVANYVRTLEYNDKLWNILLGQPQSLPRGVLSSEEQRVLKNMIAQRFFGRKETGVVRMPNGDTVAMGHVINGIRAGIRRNPRLSLASWSEDAQDPVDNLFVSTLAGTLARTGLENKNDPSKVLFGTGGHWTPNIMCPKDWTTGSQTKASKAQILGDIDGFILGYTISKLTAKGVRLGQLLRMYYTTGILYDKSYIFCNRVSKIKQLIPANRRALFGQVVVFSSQYYNKNKGLYKNVNIRDIIGIAKKTVLNAGGFYSYIDKTLSGSSCHESTGEQNIGCELPANLVFIMDESGSIQAQNYVVEKTFVNKIIDAFDISPYQTRVAVVEYSSESRLSINLDDYGSKTRLKCAVQKFHYLGGGTETDKAIKMAYNQILRPAQENNTVIGNKIPQIVILLTDGETNYGNRNALRQAVSQIKREIKDLTILTVGVGGYNIRELQLIATDPIHHVFKASNFAGLIKLVTSLQNSTCATPVTVDIDFSDRGKATVIRAFVSPKRPRYFVIPRERLIGLKNLYIEIMPIYGTVVVYASRHTRTPGPSNYTYKIDPLDVGEKMTLHIFDPCQGNNHTCTNIYLAIYGATSTLSCSENSCTLPNQIKFTIRKGSKARSSSDNQWKFPLPLIFTSLIFFFVLVQ